MFLSMVAPCLQKPGIDLPEGKFIPLAASWAAEYGIALFLLSWQRATASLHPNARTCTAVICLGTLPNLRITDNDCGMQYWSGTATAGSLQPASSPRCRTESAVWYTSIPHCLIPGLSCLTSLLPAVATPCRFLEDLEPSFNRARHARSLANGMSCRNRIPSVL